MSNPRIRSAVLAFFFGGLGIDMLLLRPHQQMLFLFLGGPILATIVVCGILSVTAGAGWGIIAGAGLVFMEFWALARFFEYLNLTDEQFQQRLDESNARSGQPAPRPVPGTR